MRRGSSGALSLEGLCLFGHALQRLALDLL